ncbi:hypothetical protein PQE66_gp138 [Bacillus phage PBC2]|uniref:Uncharacterized protein n=1 Tax=Bacillus phage PBC2 TaxID=1675029 RepID=A0A218KC40_9CAUD|nr:hypothetical protein PQE66_gp138 [Bacillus phage PBC2]AKQ08453.1 hypothetical protein PBC2_138 [Bacillus phage PBC2]
MEERKIEAIEVGGHNVFHSAEDVGKNLDVWDKELKIDDDKTLEQVIKEVALQEGISEDEVRKHLKLFQDSMRAPKSKTKKEKAKAKSKRKMAKKSKKKNR